MAPTTRAMAARMIVQELTGPDVTTNIIAEEKTPGRGRPSRRSPKKPFIGPKRLRGRPRKASPSTVPVKDGVKKLRGRPRTRAANSNTPKSQPKGGDWNDLAVVQCYHSNPPELKRRASARIAKRVADKAAIARGTTEPIAPPQRQATIVLECTTKANHGKKKGPAKSSLTKKSSQKRKRRWSVRKSLNNAVSGTNKKEKRPKADVPQKSRGRRLRSPTLCELLPVIYPDTRRHRKLIQLRAEAEAVAAKSKPTIEIVERAESEADGSSCNSPTAMEIRSLQSEFTRGGSTTLTGGASSQIYYLNNINDLTLSGTAVESDFVSSLVHDLTPIPYFTYGHGEQLRLVNIVIENLILMHAG